jgi:hypothetical protein
MHSFPSNDDVITYHRGLAWTLEAAKIELIHMSVELRKRVLIASRTAKPGQSMLSDPIETDPALRGTVSEAREKAEELAEATGLTMGRCHFVWAKQAEILRDDHGIKWFSPVHMNPSAYFD